MKMPCPGRRWRWRAPGRRDGVAGKVRVARASWLWVPSEKSTVTTWRGPSLGNGEARGGSGCGAPGTEPLRPEQGGCASTRSRRRPRERVVRPEVGAVEADRSPGAGWRWTDSERPASRADPRGASARRGCGPPRRWPARPGLPAPLLKPGEDLPPHPFHVAGPEGGVQRHVGQQLQRRLQGVAEAVEVDPDAVRARWRR